MASTAGRLTASPILNRMRWHQRPFISKKASVTAPAYATPANNPGLTLFHCHQQQHMDYGFMTLVDYK